jgi:hypothetical protein
MDAEASALLTSIWEAKGETVPRGSTPKSTASKLDRLATAKRTEAFQEGTALKPAMFVEYFCGMKDCFAIAWTELPTDSGSANDLSPTAIKLCPASDLASGGQQLGSKLVDPVFKLVDPLISSRQGNRLLVVLALDSAMWNRNLDSAPLGQERKWNFAPLKSSGQSNRLVGWSSLSDLRSGSAADQAADFEFLRALSDAKAKDAPAGAGNSADAQWAAAQISKAAK